MWAELGTEIPHLGEWKLDSACDDQNSCHDEGRGESIISCDGQELGRGRSLPLSSPPLSPNLHWTTIGLQRKMVSRHNDGSPERILRPRPVKPNPTILRAQEDDGIHLQIDTMASGLSR
jgi:hypothetical protein